MEKYKLVTYTSDPIEIDTDYECGDERADIDMLIDFLEKAKAKGAKQIEFSGYRFYGDCVDLHEIKLSPVTVEFESEEDFKIRKSELQNAEKESVKWQEKLERQEYERLKKKYG